MNSEISIVTPSYNQGRYITATLESVLGQRYPGLEYLVVDGGSGDNTQEILRGYGDAIQWISEPDRGQADAINRGFRGTHGEILGWLNADDVYCPGSLKEVSGQFESDPDLMMLYGDGHHIDVEGAVIDKYPTAAYCWERLAFHCFICQPACFFRRSLLEAAGYLNPNLHYALDLDLWIRFGIAQSQNPRWKFRHLPRVLALSRMHSENKTLSKRREVYQEIMAVVRTHYGFTPFNWVYGQEEAASRLGDGYFRRHSFSVSLLSRSILRWMWMNRGQPSYVLGFVADCLKSPRSSVRRMFDRTLPPAQAEPEFDRRKPRA